MNLRANTAELRTGIHAVEIVLYQVIQLQYECPGFSEERCIMRNILDICPDNAVASHRLGGRCTPD